jgi:segregation and condensation protein A
MFSAVPDPAVPDLFETPSQPPAAEAFVVDLAGFEGPLDLLLDLARRQKVDLARLSIAALAEQYLAFIEEARRRRLELAADYLVMAAWLAFLKSRLLLPTPEPEAEAGAEELALALAHRLRRLEAMREAAQYLAGRDRLGRDVFARGAPEGVVVDRSRRWEASLHDLLSAYASQRQETALARVTIRQRPVLTLAEARAALERIAARLEDWTRLDGMLGELAPKGRRRSALASGLSAGLELVRDGSLEMRQEAPFAPLWLRRPEAAGKGSEA